MNKQPTISAKLN